MGCFNECWHMTDELGKNTGCKLYNKEFSRDDFCPEHCPNFKFIESCPNCIHHKTEIYGSGTFDGVGYLCTLQDDKEVFQDVRPLSFNYSDIPECPIGKFQKE